MSSTQNNAELFVNQDYKYGFVTEIEQETVPPGLNEDVVRLISAKKHEPAWLTEWRLNAFRQWTHMKEPKWAMVNFPAIDFQAISYYSAPKVKDRPKIGRAHV